MILDIFFFSFIIILKLLSMFIFIKIVKCDENIFWDMLLGSWLNVMKYCKIFKLLVLMIIFKVYNMILCVLRKMYFLYV